MSMSVLLGFSLKGCLSETTNAVAERLVDSASRTLPIDAGSQRISAERWLGETSMLNRDCHRSTPHDQLAATIEGESMTAQIPPYDVYKPSVIPCSIPIDEFSASMANAWHGFLRPARKQPRSKGGPS